MGANKPSIPPCARCDGTREISTIDKANRNGIKFHCKACGHKEHADVVGGRNIGNAISGLAAA